MTTLEIVEIFSKEDLQPQIADARAIPEIVKAIDLITKTILNLYVQRLKLWGYNPFLVSIKNKQGIDLLIDKFKNKYNLQIDLISDEEGNICESFGTWKEKKNYGRIYMGIERSTFLIDEEGIIIQAWRKVRGDGHVEEVLETLKALKK